MIIEYEIQLHVSNILDILWNVRDVKCDYIKPHVYNLSSAHKKTVCSTEDHNELTVHTYCHK